MRVQDIDCDSIRNSQGLTIIGFSLGNLGWVDRFKGVGLNQVIINKT